MSDTYTGKHRPGDRRHEVYKDFDTDVLYRKYTTKARHRQYDIVYLQRFSAQWHALNRIVELRHTEVLDELLLCPTDEPPYGAKHEAVLLNVELAS